MATWNLARRLRVAVIALALLLMLAAAMLVAVLWEADRAVNEQSERTFPARLAASQLLTSLVDQETGLRGYALTGDEQFLEPYRQGLVDEQAARARLDVLIGPDDPARVSLLSIDAAITAWRDQYASLRIGGDNVGEPDSTIEFGRQLFERVRQTNADLDARLALQLDDAQAAIDRDRRLVAGVLALVAVAFVATVVALQRALKNSVLRPVNSLAEQVRRVSQGQHNMPIEPEGPPDIREMAEDVESMRHELVAVLAEVEQQRRAIEQRAAELARSNADLEQFAYVASHDLQEPLRKVASFCQLLEQRYHGQLDDRADQYIAFAVDGAKRMQLLISDLLTFSRVGRTSDRFVDVDLVAVIEHSWASLDVQIAQTGARLDVDVAARSQRVHGDRSLVQMLFTNLFSNAIKYRRPDCTPTVHVSSSVEDRMVRVEVVDNGIGIPAEYADKVFAIFQRLHSRDEYEGTGIGLALAKKIVEFHGGSIQVRPGQTTGTCMSFTLPIEQTPADD